MKINISGLENLRKALANLTPSQKTGLRAMISTRATAVREELENQRKKAGEAKAGTQTCPTCGTPLPPWHPVCDIRHP